MKGALVKRVVRLVPCISENQRSVFVKDGVR
jgi:hypothetical protein